MNAITKIERPQSLSIRQPGIHFGLPETVYHSDDALGSGSIRALAKCPIYYWQDSWMNPLREPDRETDALLFGRALHKVVLEGLEAFRQSYAPIPVASDFPDCVDTATDAKKRLKALGEKQTGVKEELIARLKSIDPTVVVFDDILGAFTERCRKGGITMLPKPMYEKVIVSAGFIAGDERVRAAFQGGRPEVSLFWVEDGVAMKARLDYVRLGRDRDRTVGIVTDLKSFANVMDHAPERAVINAIAGNRLDIQAAAYMRGIARIPEFIADGNVYGADCISAEWIDALGRIEIGGWRWFWCFYEKNMPVSLLRSTLPGSAMIEAANMDLNRALSAYRENMERFGVSWRFTDPLADTEVTQTDLPKYMYSGV